MKKVLAFVGMAGSGKGTCTDYLESKGYPKVYFGGMVYEEVEKRGLDIVQYEKEVREDMRAQDGPEVLAKRASTRADEYFSAGHEVVVFDGLYSWDEYKFLKEKYGEDLIVIAIAAPLHIRYQRIVERRDGKRIYTLEDAIRRDHEEIEYHKKGGPIAMANFTLANTRSTKELLSELDSVLAELDIPSPKS